MSPSPPPPAEEHLKIAIIGFGNYGQFLAKTFVSQGHTVVAHSRSDHSSAAKSLGVSFFSDPRRLFQQNPEVVLLSTSIISTEAVLKSLPLHTLNPNALFVDVLSVKEFPKSLMLDVLPGSFDIICAHPMFGPQSAKNGWRGLDFVYELVRIGDGEGRIDRCGKFLDIFGREGCRMVEMSCREHDVHAAESQFVTHTVGRVLGGLGLESTPINTKGYESLLDLVEYTSGDSFDLYYGLFVYNKNAVEMLDKLDLAFDSLRTELFSRLDEAGRGQSVANGDPWLRFEGEDGGALEVDSSSLRHLAVTQPYKYNAEDSAIVNDSSKLKIAIVGFGNFGQFLARTFVQQGHNVSAHSRSDYSDIAKQLGVSYFSNMDDLFEEHPELVLLCTSILSTEKVLKSLPIHKLKRGTLFVDVLSVKEFPKKVLLRHLPPDFDVLCTHPMFGPESGKHGWTNLRFVFEKVRIGRAARVDKFLDIFAREGCTMIEMSCEEHDRYAAGSQFITHTVGRVLERLGLESTPINTRGYETLLDLVENTAGDSFDLYYGLFMYNVNALEQLERLGLVLQSLKKQLCGEVQSVFRNQPFASAAGSPVMEKSSSWSTQ